MIPKLLWFPLLFLSGWLAGQREVSGVVRDSLTGAPVPFVTVYFDGTTTGTSSEEDGSFSLSLADINLPAVLVATHLSYQSAQLLIETADASPAFRLTAAANEIAAVEVGDRNNRAKNLAEFREYYLGTDAWSKRARIENEERLRFDRTYATDTLRNADILVERYGLPEDLRKVKWAVDGKSLTFEQARDLQANSAGPLRIDVPALGYRLTVNLIRFVIDYPSGGIFGLGTYYFEPYEGADGKAKGAHVKHRRQTYYHSSQHFLRALFAGSLDAEGFAVYEMVGDEARPIDLGPHLRQVSPTEMALRRLEGRRLAVLYYHDGRGRPLPPDRRKRAAYTTSYLTVVGPEATFRADGTLGDSPITFGGAMGATQVTRLLPSDYNPD